MRTFVAVTVTIIVTALGLGSYARWTRPANPPEPTLTELAAKLDALQRDMDKVVGCAHHSIKQHGELRRQIDQFREEQSSLLQRNRQEFLRLLIEDRDNQELYRVRQQIIDRCAAAERVHALVGVGDCIRVAIDTQTRMFEMRRRLVPPDQLIVYVGPWTGRLNAELKGLRDKQYEQFLDVGGE